MPRLRMSVVALTLVAGLLAPAAAFAVTVDQIVSLSRAGVTDAVILALIDRDRTIFAIEPDQLVALKEQGVSEQVILAMLKSGRDEGERAAQAAADLNSGFIMSGLANGPEVVEVGHGPDVPNGGWSPYSANQSIYVPPIGGVVGIPYAIGGGGGRRRGRMAPPVAPSAATPQGRPFLQPFTQPFTSPFHEAPVARPTQPPAAMLCQAQVQGPNSTVPLTFVTPCPSMMQSSRGR